MVTEHDAVLLLSFDLPYPQPMHPLRPIHGTLGIALLLAREQEAQAMARLDLELLNQPFQPTSCTDPELERLRANNPTGRALPLLAALAAGASAEVNLEYVAENSLRVRLTGLRRTA